jgi:beta-phosphoglucomutase
MPSAFEGGIFDVDGVLVDSPHQRAWRESLRELMEGDWREIRDRTSWSPDRFTPEVYERVMSGKPRMSGAHAALDYFEVPDVDRRAVAYANLKQSMVVDLIKAGKFTAYPDALRFILAVKGAGIRVAAASSSKNAGLFLRQIRLDDFATAERLSYDFVTPGLSLLELFDADVSGRDFAHGKPDPEIFLTAAAELRSPPHRCFVIEDAVSGIQAAKAGGMAALGIARADDADVLAKADADLVVSSLDDVDVESLIDGVLGTSRAGPPPRTAGRPSDRVVETTEMNYERQLDPQALGDHIDRLYRAAWALCGSREEAENLVQETFARVLRRPRTLSADNDLGYLLRALRNTFLSTRRTVSRRPRTEPCPDQLEFIEDRHAAGPEASLEAAEVYAAISEFPDDLRDTLVAIDVVGLSYREAAHALGVREATITTRLYRARQRVAHALLANDEATRQAS